MPSATILINSPILIAPAHFSVRYRLLPAGAWVVYGNADNTAFVIAGLAAGAYELGIKVVNADDTECAEVIRTFTVAEAECECLEVTNAVIQAATGGGTYHLILSYTLPAPQPACGWSITYGPTGGIQSTVTYATLPASPLQLPVSANVPHSVLITANCCEGNTTDCYDAVVDVDDDPADPCVPLTLANTTIDIVRDLAGNWYMRIQITGSPTLCDIMYYSFNQYVPPVYGITGNNVSGFWGTFALSGGVYTYLKPFTPALFVMPGDVIYSGYTMDCCGNKLVFGEIVYTGTYI